MRVAERFLISGGRRPFSRFRGKGGSIGSLDDGFLSHTLPGGGGRGEGVWMRRWVFHRIGPVRNSRGRRIPEFRSFWFSQVFLWPPFADREVKGVEVL
jgi:hypothetical protein